ncbi:FGGY-family carbohydrate kinase [Bacillus velezensis]|uniref:FGGY-family carbohydrate kinase n=1 Tax=Bacillus velezensis TaxID=492670 RepID=UPI003453A45E
MAEQKGYLVFDIGTGNARVAVVTAGGEVTSLEREDIEYVTDPLYPDGRYFSPEGIWKQISAMARKVIAKSPHITLIGITSTSQRQGIVLINKDKKAFLGLPNIDNRGREWEDGIEAKEEVHQQTGRLPSALFSAMKLVGLKARQPSLWKEVKYITSISDWVTFELSGILSYEPSQAAETLLFDVRKKVWSEKLCNIFGVPSAILPSLVRSETVVGMLTFKKAAVLGLSERVPVIAGGGDTQLAIKSADAKPGDIVIVSGTTTPITKITAETGTESLENAWLNCHTEEGQWLLETNPGVTGLNYQKLKSIFYPNESYGVMEREIASLPKHDHACISALGSYLSPEKNALAKGGFIFDAPLSQNLSRAHFVKAALLEIAFSIKWNYEALTEVASFSQDDVKVCGGGFQSDALTQFLANLLQKKIYKREGFSQASAMGAVMICNEALGVKAELSSRTKVIEPEADQTDLFLYEEWKHTQKLFTHFQPAVKA